MQTKPNSFDDFYKAYRNAMINRVVGAIVYRMSRSEAEEIVQEAMLSAWMGWDTCKEPDEKRGAWIMGILQFKISHHVRDRDRAGRPATFNFDEQSYMENLSVQEETPEQVWESVERAADLDQKMKALDAHNSGWYEVVYMRNIHGLSYQQISDRLAVPLNTVRTRIRRGMAFLGIDNHFNRRTLPLEVPEVPTLAGPSVKVDHPWYQKDGTPDGPEYREPARNNRPNHYDIGGPTVEPKCPGYRKCPVCANFPDKDTMQ